MRRAGLRAGHRCLDLGCGSGELTYRLAELAAPGEVVGVDFDRGVVAVATERARPRRLIAGRVRRKPTSGSLPDGSTRDLLARAMRSHARAPARRAEARCRVAAGARRHGRARRTPTSRPLVGAAVARSLSVTSSSARPTRARGRRTPGPGGSRTLLDQAGFERVEESVDQDVARDGEGKRLTELSLERTRAALLADDLADDAEIDALLAELRRVSTDPRTLIRSPRLHQLLGRRPVSA